MLEGGQAPPTVHSDHVSRSVPTWDRALSMSHHCAHPPCNFPEASGGWDAPSAGGPSRYQSVTFKKELLCAVLNRRSRAAAAAVAAAAHTVAADATSHQGPQGSKWRRTATFSWEEHVRELTEKDFKRRYRITSRAFHDVLLPKLWDKLSLATDAAVRLSLNGRFGTIVEPATKLALCLRFMAGGDPLDLKLIYKVDISYVYKCVWMCVDAINDAFKMPFPIDDPDKLARLEAEFRAASHGGVWAGQVGAVDGVHFPMMAPTLREVHNPMKYYVSRKGEYAILCMATCDAARRITDFDMSQVPQTHDSMAFLMSELGSKVDAGLLPAPYFLNADSAFSPTSSMMTPSGGQLDDYDYHQSSNRMPIECAFGIIIRRWGCLYRPLRVAFHRRAALIGACIHMHNFCIDMRIEDETHRYDVHGITEIQPDRWAVTPLFDKEGRPVEHLEILRGPAHRPRSSMPPTDSRYATRLKLAAAIAEAGLHRPALPTGVLRKSKRSRGGVGSKAAKKRGKATTPKTSGKRRP